MWRPYAHGTTVGQRGTEGGVTSNTMGARESRSSATAATSRSRSRAPFKVGSSTLSTLAEHRALEGELQALENGWREAEEIAGIADRLRAGTRRRIARASPP